MPAPRGRFAFGALLAVATVLGACGTDHGGLSPGPASPSLLPSVATSVTVFRGSRDEWLARLHGCLRDRGWSITPTDDGGWRIDVPNGQQGAYSSAREECIAELGPMPSTPVLTESDIRERYAYLVRARQCLIDLGYSITDPPTVERFLDTWASGPWSPYIELGDQTSPAEWEVANRACPQVPGR
jgi:hypothetical protein